MTPNGILNVLIYSVLILLVTIAVYAIAQRRSAAGNAQAWDQFMLALNRMERDKLEDIAENNPHTAVGHWSLFMAHWLPCLRRTGLLCRGRRRPTPRRHVRCRG